MWDGITTKITIDQKHEERFYVSAVLEEYGTCINYCACVVLVLCSSDRTLRQRGCYDVTIYL